MACKSYVWHESCPTNLLCKRLSMKKIIYINHNLLQTKLVRYYFESSSKKYMYKFCIGIKVMLKNNVANVLVKNYVIKLYV